jgi:hypothetical protein
METLYFSKNITNKIHNMIYDKIHSCFIGIYKNTDKKYYIKKILKTLNYEKVIIKCNTFNLQNYDTYDEYDNIIDNIDEIYNIKLNEYYNIVENILIKNPKISDIYFYDDPDSIELFNVTDNIFNINHLINLRNIEIQKIKYNINKIEKNKKINKYNFKNYIKTFVIKNNIQIEEEKKYYVDKIIIPSIIENKNSDNSGSDEEYYLYED